jgi:hypothetical protein
MPITPIFFKTVGDSPVNSKVLTVIGVGATSEGGFGSTRRSQKADISHIDYETCQDIANPVRLYLPLCLSTVATPVVLFFTGKVRGRKD